MEPSELMVQYCNALRQISMLRRELNDARGQLDIACEKIAKLEADEDMRRTNAGLAPLRRRMPPKPRYSAEVIELSERLNAELRKPHSVKGK